MTRHVQIGLYWTALGTLAAVLGMLTVRTIHGSCRCDVVAIELERMRKYGKDFDPTRLHTLGVEGLRRVLCSVRDKHARCFVSRTPSYAAGFGAYARGINDRARLLVLAEYLRTHLNDDVRHYGEFSLNHDKVLIIRSCVEAFERNDQDENAVRYAAALAPCLKYTNCEVGLWLIRALAGHDNGHPLIAYELMIEALDSDCPALVREAVSNATECARQTKRRQLVYKRLLKIFHGPDEENKFNLSFALMHQFQDREAIDFLLQQAASADKERAIRSIVWIGDTCNWGQEPYPAFLTAMDPLLKSKDREVRRSAVEAISIYAGSEVTNRLLNALADDHQEIVEIARRGLTERAIGRALRLRDDDLTVTLERLAETHENAQVRRECLAILEAVQRDRARTEGSVE